MDTFSSKEETTDPAEKPYAVLSQGGHDRKSVLGFAPTGRPRTQERAHPTLIPREEKDGIPDVGGKGKGRRPSTGL
jgi:hypothetical protein